MAPSSKQIKAFNRIFDLEDFSEDLIPAIATGGLRVPEPSRRFYVGTQLLPFSFIISHLYYVHVTCVMDLNIKEMSFDLLTLPLGCRRTLILKKAKNILAKIF